MIKQNAHLRLPQSNLNNKPLNSVGVIQRHIPRMLDQNMFAHTKNKEKTTKENLHVLLKNVSQVQNNYLMTHSEN